ncbi:DnaD domain-containing protein [Companilactobacillus kedongensis]|uniref:DnaD domain-containing protein n=1 Tax=Companilactobacillus kedongensis TaxID=2486004 RepID=UPI000F7A12BB|nr:DnaD domain protein [Companilactobacillus kedongensis]
MNYLKQLQAFRDYQLFKTELSSGQISLYYALLQINNKCSWVEWFTAANQMLETLSGLSRSGINKNRNILKQLGLVDFKSNGNRKATSYKICVLYTLDSTHNSEHNSTHKSTHNSEHNSTHKSEHKSAHNSSTLLKHKHKQDINETKQDHHDGDAVPNSANNDTNPDNDALFRDLLTFYQQNIGVTGSIVIENLRHSLDDFVEQGTSLDESIEIIKYAIKLTVENDAHSWNYTSKILMNWLNSNLYTLDNIKASNRSRNQHNNIANSSDDFMERSNRSAKETGIGF